MINQVVLVGRLTRDPELKYTTNGIANLRFSLAVNRNYKGQNGEAQADFINCVAWRNQAENMAKFLRKGSLIGVEGRIETGSYQAQDGSTRYTTDVIADGIQFLESKKTEPQIPGAERYAAPDPNHNQPEPGSGKTMAEMKYNQHDRVANKEAGFNHENPFPNSSMPGFNGGTPPINITDDDLPF